MLFPGSRKEELTFEFYCIHFVDIELISFVLIETSLYKKNISSC